MRFTLWTALAMGCVWAGDLDMIVDSSRPFGLIAYDVGDYVQDGLIAHFDGIRNVGANLPHDTTVNTWANLVPGGASAVFRTCNTFALDASAEGRWTKKGYYFDAKSYAVMTSPLVLSTNFTAQLVANIDPTQQPDLPEYYPNYLSNVLDFGFFASPGSAVNRAKVYWKVDICATNRPFIYPWKGRYFSAGLDEGHAYLTDTDSWNLSSGLCKERAVTNTLPALAWSWGGNDTSEARAALRYSRGEFYAVRFYNRLLTDAELQHNQMVDEARFHQSIAETNVIVDTSIGGVSEFATGPFAVNGAHTFTGPGTFTQDGVTYATVGYTLERWNADSNTWFAAESVTATSYAYTNCLHWARVRLIWQVEPVGGARRYDIAHYAPGGLVLHFDGICNAGIDQPHNAAATVWTNLVEGGIHAAHGDAGEGTMGQWGANGYVFAGADWWVLEKALTLGDVTTFQAVTSLSASEQTRSYPSVFGGAADVFNFYTYDTQTKLYLKVQRSPSEVARVWQSSWEGQYLTAIQDYKSGCVFQTVLPPQTTALLRPLDDRVFYIGGVPVGSTASNQLLRCAVGTIHAIRLYNRHLSKDELFWNRELDDYRFRGQMPTSSNVVEIVASGPQGTGTTDGLYRFYGTHTFTTAPGTRVAGQDWVCAGCQVETWDAATQQYVDPVRYTGTSCTLAPSAARRRLTWLWHEPYDLRGVADFRVRDYVREGLVAHYDGIRNVGEWAPHDANAEKWVDLVQGSTLSLYGANRISGSWTNYGYTLRQESYWKMDSKVTIGMAMTVQEVTDIDFASSTNAWPNYFVIEKDYGYFSRDNTKSTTWKFDKWGSASSSDRISLTWDGRYITAGCDAERMYLTQNATWGAGKPRTLFKEIGEYAWCIGGADGATYTPTRYSNGTFKSFRLYSRLLTEEELVWNRLVDRARFDGVLERTNVLVATSHPQLQGAEAAGPYVVKQEWNFTAATVTQGRHTYVLDGYSLETLNNGVWSAPVYYSGTNYVHQTAVQPAPVRLTWQWHLKGGFVINLR